MTWWIASVPFWILGSALVVGGILAPFERRPGETNSDLVFQFILGLVAGGVVLVLAAKIAS